MNSNTTTPIASSGVDAMLMHSYSTLIKTYPDCPKYVPFALLDERQANINHNQTLRRLNERGGLYPTEMIAIIAKRPCMPNQDVGKAIQSINVHLANHNKASQPHPSR